MKKQKNRRISAAMPSFFFEAGRMLHRCYNSIKASKQEVLQFLCKTSSWSEPSSPFSKTRESFPSALRAKQTTCRGLSMRPIKEAVNMLDSDEAETLKP